jgi:hypothetical protein
MDADDVIVWSFAIMVAAAALWVVGAVFNEAVEFFDDHSYRVREWLRRRKDK